MNNTMLKLLLAFVLVLSANVEAIAHEAKSFCADDSQTGKVRAFAVEHPGAPSPIGERMLGVLEEIYVSALPAGNSLGTTADNFKAIWDSLSEWSGSVTYILTTGGTNVFKFYDPISKWGVNTRGDAFFDVKPANKGYDGLDAHIRADLITSIYAVNLPKHDGSGAATQGVIFFREDGHSMFAVYAQIAGEPIPDERKKEFLNTWSLIESMPRLCQ